MATVEEIARRWFQMEPCTHSPRWDAQPESIKDQYRALANQFWADPGKLTRELQVIAVSARQMVSNIDRATKAWTDDEGEN